MKNIYTTLALVICLLSHSNAQLTGITPNQAYPGQNNLTTTISSTGLFIQAMSPSGNIYQIYLQQGGYSFFLFDFNTQWNATVLNSNTVECTQVNIPIGAPTGLYDLHVITGDVQNPWWNQSFYNLPSAFTVTPPDGRIEGNVFIDLNLNYIKDAGEPGLQNATILVNPGNYSVQSNAQGIYGFPGFNGSYSLTYQTPVNSQYRVAPVSYSSIAINNDTVQNINFALRPAFTSVSPNYLVSQSPLVFAGINLTSDSIFTSTPSQVRLTRSTGFPSFSASTIVVNNINQLYASFNIANSSTYQGLYHMDVTVSGVTYRYYNCVTFLPPEGSISGTVFKDDNSNGIWDAGEFVVSNRKIQHSSSNYIAITNVTGNYSMGLQNATHTLTYLPLGFETVTTPNPLISTINNNSIINKNYGVNFSNFDSITSTISGLFRCNSYQTLTIKITNEGGTTPSGLVKFVKSPFMNYISSIPAPQSVSGDTIIWSYSNLPFGQSINLKPHFLMPAGGTICEYTLSTEIHDVSGNVIWGFSKRLSSTTICAYDPNDKSVSPVFNYLPTNSSYYDGLYYTIRFQNTGNDTAFRVIITDTLSPWLDFNTFNLLDASHNVAVEFNNINRALKFSFYNILLPDSNVNEPGSHGKVQFEIKPVANIPSMTLIENKANIYFDLNPPIITNQTQQTFYDCQDIDQINSVFTNAPDSICNSQYALYWVGGPLSGSSVWYVDGNLQSVNDTLPIYFTQPGLHTITSYFQTEYCTDSITKLVYVFPVPQVTPSDTITVCPGVNVQLTSTTAISYNWNTGATTQSINVTQPGYYLVQAYYSLICQSWSDTVWVANHPAPPVPLVQFVNINIIQTDLVGYSYQWYLNGNPLSGDTTQSIAISQTGNYSVVVTNQFGCTTSSSGYPFIVGIDEDGDDAYFTVAPVPFSDELTIYLKRFGIYEIELYSTDGRLVKRTFADKQARVEWNTAKLDAGIYLISIKSSDGNKVRRLIKL